MLRQGQGEPLKVTEAEFTFVAVDADPGRLSRRATPPACRRERNLMPFRRLSASQRRRKPLRRTDRHIEHSYKTEDAI